MTSVEAVTAKTPTNSLSASAWLSKWASAGLVGACHSGNWGTRWKWTWLLPRSEDTALRCNRKDLMFRLLAVTAWLAQSSVQSARLGAHWVAGDWRLLKCRFEHSLPWHLLRCGWVDSNDLLLWEFYRIPDPQGRSETIQFLVCPRWTTNRIGLLELARGARWYAVPGTGGNVSLGSLQELCANSTNLFPGLRRATAFPNIGTLNSHRRNGLETVRRLLRFTNHLRSGTYNHLKEWPLRCLLAGWIRTWGESISNHKMMLVPIGQKRLTKARQTQTDSTARMIFDLWEIWISMLLIASRGFRCGIRMLLVA